jgi:hypothetical protein
VGPIAYDADSSEWAAHILSALTGITSLIGIRVVGSGPVPSTAGLSYYFDVYFEGSADHRNHELLTVQSNNLTPSTVVIDISKIAQGGPINAIATLIDFDTIAPNGVSFIETSVSSPYTIGDLQAGDGFPIWVQRTVASGTEAISNDGFTMGIKGCPVEE